MTDQQYNPQLLNEEEESENMITLNDIIQMVLVNWQWFALSILLSLGIAFLQITKTPKVYNRTATVLVKDSRKGGDLDVSAFSDLAGFRNRRSVDNEAFILRSNRLMTQVVKELDLTKTYLQKGFFQDRDLYGRSPLDVEFINDTDEQSMRVSVTILEGDIVLLTQFEERDIEKEARKREIVAQLGDTISTPIGQMVVNKTLYMRPEYLDSEILVGKQALKATAAAYRHSVSIEVANEEASVIVISKNDIIPRRGEDVINTLIKVYNDDAIEDKRQVSVTTSDFVKERLAIIGEELSNVDKGIAQLKQENRMVDISSEANRTLNESSRYKAEGLSIENQINVAEFIRDYLNNPDNTKELIPMMASINNNGINTQIQDFNTAILQRKKLLENSSEKNPVIQDMDNMLASVRRSILSSLDSHISTLRIQYKSIQEEERHANSRISAMPSQEKVILSIARQQKIKEELFLYLLNKQEETQLNFAIAESNARVIDNAYGSNIPVSPKPMMILLAACIIGFAIPLGVFFLKNMLDTTIRDRRDVENKISAPFLGEIPSTGDDEHKSVHEAGRDPLSEAFRILRSNMSFMNISQEKAIKTILVTSSEPHAGKTFVSSNLAITLAIANKKVLLIDLDLRRHAFSTQNGHGKTSHGVTAYLSGTINQLDEIIKPSNMHANLDVIYAGIQPPNPTEMLMSKRLDQLFEELRQRYDFIIIDSTPSMAVADAVITDRLSDLCMYILREGVQDRRQLPNIERIYNERKFHNMCIVLNGTSNQHQGYGYGYGRSYGYNYGYGYDSELSDKKYDKGLLNKIYRRIFARK